MPEHQVYAVSTKDNALPCTSEPSDSYWTLLHLFPSIHHPFSFPHMSYLIFSSCHSLLSLPQIPIQFPPTLPHAPCSFHSPPPPPLPLSLTMQAIDGGSSNGWLPARCTAQWTAAMPTLHGESHATLVPSRLPLLHALTSTIIPYYIRC